MSASKGIWREGSFWGTSFCIAVYSKLGNVDVALRVLALQLTQLLSLESDLSSLVTKLDEIILTKLPSSKFCDFVASLYPWQILSDGEAHLKGRKIPNNSFLKHNKARFENLLPDLQCECT
jgi:hypothetical protein